MSDQCRHCSYYDRLYDCRQAECFQHENWFAVQILEENKQLRTTEEELRRDVETLEFLLGNAAKKAVEQGAEIKRIRALVSNSNIDR